MNLVFFTVELERNRDRPVVGGSRFASPPLWSRFRWIGLAIAAVICAAAVGCGGWVLAGGDPPIAELPEWVGLSADSTRTGASGRVWLEVTSRPNKATVFVDGHEKGKTPLSLAVSKATHTLVLKHPDAADDQRKVNVSTDMRVSVSMWRRRPDAVQLKPPYPGATISDAGFLGDGRLALSMAIPAQTGGLGGSVSREAWIFDSTIGSLEPFETDGAAPHAAVVAVSPDGRRVAYLQAAQPEMQRGSGASRLSEVWVAGGGSGGPPVQVLALPSKNSPAAPGSAPSEVEEVHDVAWTPDSRYLLVIAQLVSVSGGYPAAPRSRLLVVDAPSGNQVSSPTAMELVTLPAKVVRGSYTWAPDGHWVAFLTQGLIAYVNANLRVPIRVMVVGSAIAVVAILVIQPHANFVTITKNGPTNDSMFFSVRLHTSGASIGVDKLHVDIRSVRSGATFDEVIFYNIQTIPAESTFTWSVDVKFDPLDPTSFTYVFTLDVNGTVMDTSTVT